MNDVYDRLVKLMMDVMNMQADEIKPDCTFDDLDFDSLALVELILVAKKEFGVSIDEDELSPDHSILCAARIIEAKGVSV